MVDGSVWNNTVEMARNPPNHGWVQACVTLGHGLTHGGFRGSRLDHQFRLGFLLLQRIWEVAGFWAVAGEAPWILAFGCSGHPVVSVELWL
ncbi:hypothetical protein FH972_026983 [Carpinus fangiana]|uniref:Uncharacterized protein n=1 Tax=Carpinus fangiana TaxID=176857 RepID=A0A5N6L5V6_9ROSI|nr:hypothetical protein FH972_026983 [Carpinus fangiana]